MYCPNCGTQLSGPHCGVCGAPAPSTLANDATSQGVLAGWWRRVAATVVDNLILFIPSLVVYVVVGDVTDALVGALAVIAVQGTYMVILLASPSGQTIGNRVAGSRVRDALTGHTLTKRQAYQRWIPLALYSVFELTGSTPIIMLVGIVAAADYLSPLFSSRKQTLHDKLASTIVTRV